MYVQADSRFFMGVFCGELVHFVAPFCLTSVDISVHQEWFARFRERANRPGAVVRACRCQGQIKKKRGHTVVGTTRNRL
jgi:hypothetical protein